MIATAARKVYYCFDNNNIWVASKPNLLASFLNLEITSDCSKINFYKSKDFPRLNNSNIGNTTIYDPVFQLMPNHFLDFSSDKTQRYWPNKRIEYLPLEEVATKCAVLIKGYMKSITNRYSIMLPVTAGKDSRILLAATKEFSKSVYYYVNKEPQLSPNHKDIKVPRKLFAKLGLDFHVIEPGNNIHDDFRKLFFENNQTAPTRYLPFIYNYYVNHSDKVNVPGNIASAGLEMFKHTRHELTVKTLVRIYQLQHYKYAKEYFEKWLSECLDLCKLNNVNLFNLFYWEERLPNRGSQTQMEKDIAQEDINIYNSRMLVELMLSANPKYIKPPFFELHKEIVRILWPDVLKVPINPGLRSTYKKILAIFRMLDLVYLLRKKFLSDKK